MKKAIPLSVLPRDLTADVKVLRSTGGVPGVMYGNMEGNKHVTCNAKELHSVYVKAGENTLVDVAVDGSTVPCLIHAIAFDPVTSAYEHVDLYAVDMKRKVTTNVPVVFTGEAPAVKNLGGVLLTVHSQLEVTCLPTAIPENFTVDLAALENLHDSITVGDLTIPDDVEVTQSPETTLIIVQEQRAEEVIEPVAVTAEGAAAEGAAPAEGAAAGAEGAATDATKKDDKGAEKKK